MGFPLLAHQVERPVGKRNIAVLISLSTANMDKPSGAVDIPNLEMGPLLKPEAAGVDGGKTRPVSEQAHTRQDTAHLIGT
jgi:hypothetical protein